MRRLKAFVEQVYLPDVVEVAKAFPDYFALGKSLHGFLSYGNFPEGASSRYFPAGVVINGKFSELNVSKITESVHSAYFSSPSGLHPSAGQTTADPKKNGAYTWLKAPRYDGEPLEVGPLARLMVACKSSSDNEIKSTATKILADHGKTLDDLNSVMGRHLCRAIEAKLISKQLEVWLNKLKPSESCHRDFMIPDSAQGYGLAEAPRGALGHWIEIRGGKISNYQCVVPTTWNCSPRDEKGFAGPIEAALVGTPIADADNPLEAARVVRSYDPCLACAVH